MAIHWKKKIFRVLLALLIFLVASYADNFKPVESDFQFSTANVIKNSAEKIVLITKVADGDTIEYLENGHLTSVRLLGVDTPETVDPRKPVQCFGKEASKYTKQLVLNKKVKLGDDVIAGKEKYGRELKYVFLEDGRMLNKILLEEGFAFATPQYKFQFKDEFVKLEKEAKIENKGLWNEQICKYKK